MASCLVIQTATRPTSYLPSTSLYKSTRRFNIAAKQLPSVAKPLSSSPRSWSLSCSTSADDDNINELVMPEIYLLLETVMGRVEIHENTGEQGNNWNTLLLSSINMMTLTATAISGLAATFDGSSHMGLNMSSFVLFTAATGMLVIMNKIQPSQLAEERRNATRLFKRIEHEIKTLIAIGKPTKADVERLMEKILVLDRAYPLALLGVLTIEKFPSAFEPARWWPDESGQENIIINTKSNAAGWSETLETELRDIVQVLKMKDMEECDTLGNIALKLNKLLAVSGPTLTGIAALASAFASNQSTVGSLAAAAAMVGGALACAVNSFEHGGQVGMVAEMYRNRAGEFEEMVETIESNVASRRVNGEVFEMRVALQLGRSLPELRNLARKSSNWTKYGTVIDEFASKLP